MEFTQYKCPVCNESFVSGDDVVVCPECGTPHHRSCYDKNGHCFYEDKHSEDFSFEENKNHGESAENSSESNVSTACPMCGHENEKTAFYCNHCGYPLSAEDRQSQSSAQTDNAQSVNDNQQNVPPFGFGAAGFPAFDPLAGLDKNEEIADNIKVSEMARFVGKNTQYFLLVFKRLKSLHRSKFNFAAFLFSGVYFLYRKMTGLGILFSLLVIASTVLSSYIYMTPAWSSAYNDVLNTLTDNSALLSMSYQDSAAMMGKIMLVYLPALLSGIRYVLMLLSGFFANRWYYRHSTKKIKEAKEKTTDGESGERLENAGGVNLPLAISFGAATLVISYICMFMQSGAMF